MALAITSAQNQVIDLFSGAGGMKTAIKLIEAMTGFLAIIILGLAVIGMFFR